MYFVTKTKVSLFFVIVLVDMQALIVFNECAIIYCTIVPEMIVELAIGFFHVIMAGIMGAQSTSEHVYLHKNYVINLLYMSYFSKNACEDSRNCGL